MKEVRQWTFERPTGPVTLPTLAIIHSDSLDLLTLRSATQPIVRMILSGTAVPAYLAGSSYRSQEDLETLSKCHSSAGKQWKRWTTMFAIYNNALQRYIHSHFGTRIQSPKLTGASSSHTQSQTSTKNTLRRWTFSIRGASTGSRKKRQRH